MATGFSLFYLLRAGEKNLKRFVGSQLTTNLVHTIHHKKVTLSVCPVLRNIEESGIKTSPNIGELFIKYPFKSIELGDKY